MQITVFRDDLLKPLQLLTRIIEKRKTLPVLSNILFRKEAHNLTLVATDLEIELQVRVVCVDDTESGEFTVAGHKLLEIFRAFTDNVQVVLALQADQRLQIRAGKSRFNLLTLPAQEFPFIEEESYDLELRLPQQALKQVINKTQFAIAHEDVRYYLNGLFFELSTKQLTVVATDGHRMAHCALESDSLQGVTELQRYILPRKGVTELLNVLNDSEEELLLKFSKSHLSASLENYLIISKLIDGKFPDYRKILPSKGDKSFEIDRDVLRQLLARVAILANQQYRGVYLQLRENTLAVLAHNPQHEEAQDEIAIEYTLGDLDIGCNVSYLIETLGNLDSEKVRVFLQDPDSSIQIEPVSEDEEVLKAVYIIMPMRL